MNVSRYVFVAVNSLDLLTVGVVALASMATITTLSGPDSIVAKVLTVVGLLPGILGVTLLTLLVNLARKDREVAVLRVLGVKRTDILMAFTQRAFLLGLAGACTGILAGMGIAIVMSVQVGIEMAALALLVCLGASLVGGAFAGKTVWQLQIAEVMRE